MNNVIKNDSYDQFVFKDVKSGSSKINCLVDESNDALVSDAFYSFYKMEPMLEEDGEQPLKEMIEQMMSLPEYKNLREYTQVDDISSALATLELAPPLVEEFKRRRKEQEEIDEGKRKEKDKKAEGDWRIEMRKALEEAQKKAEDSQESMGAFAGNNSEELKRMPTEDRFALAETLRRNELFKQIANLIGRFQHIVQGAVAHNYTHGYDEIVDITVGSDIMRLIPSELLKLKYNKKLFFKDLTENNLLQYNLKGEEKIGKGPIIVCMDVSGSMTEGKPAREAWAKAVALALAMLAEKQNRAFGFVAFNSKVVDSFIKPKGEHLTIKEKINLADIKSSGGTTYYEPLRKAFRLRRQHPTLKPADIVFVTDGYCGMTEEEISNLIKWKKETEVRIHTVMLQDSRDEANSELLTLISDTQHLINSLGEINYVNDIVKGVASMFK